MTIVAKNPVPQCAWIWGLAATMLVVWAAACANTTPDGAEDGDRYVYTVPEQAGDGWNVASLSDAGIQSGPITTLLSRLQDRTYREVHAVLIVKDDVLVLDKYFPGHLFDASKSDYLGMDMDYTRTNRHNTHSATKSITSALIGIAIDKGFIPSVDQTVFPYYPAYADLKTTAKEKLALKHFLTMSSGLQWNEWDLPISNPEHDIVRFNSSSDPLRYLLSKPLIHEPGTFYYYNGGGVDLLGDVVHVASNLRYDQFAEQYLFAPLGITNYEIQRLNATLYAAHGDIYMLPRDMAKFGYLFLKKGLWDGQRIVSEEWVNTSTADHIKPLPTNFDGYGYLWWRQKFVLSNATIECFLAQGWGGQRIIVIPSLNMVVVFTGANYVGSEPCDEIMTRYILPAVVG